MSVQLTLARAHPADPDPVDPDPSLSDTDPVAVGPTDTDPVAFGLINTSLGSSKLAASDPIGPDSTGMDQLDTIWNL